MSEPQQLQGGKQRRMRVIADHHGNGRRAEQSIGLRIPARPPQNFAARRRQADEIGDGRPGDEANRTLARQIEKLAGIQMNRIPFRTGTQVMPDLIAGRVSMYVSPTIGVLPQQFV